MTSPQVIANSPEVGDVVCGKYRLLSVLGSGGMGKVYEAEQLPLGRRVALKVLHPHLSGSSHAVTSDSGDGSFQKRFFREASALSKLKHRNIVTVHDYGRFEGEGDQPYFMAMELLEGQALSDVLKIRKLLPVGEAVDIARQLARGLREVHKLGLVHRDLKPGNVFLAREGDELVAKLLDFGLVKDTAVDAIDGATQAGTFLGSPAYVSPEQIEGVHVDARADVYSLGVMIYHLVAGKPPFEGSLTSLLFAHMNTPPPPFSERAPGVVVPDELSRVVMRCLAKRADERYQNVDELLSALREVEAAVGLSSQPMSLSGAVPLGAGPASTGRIASGDMPSQGSLVSLSKGSGDASSRPRSSAPAVAAALAVLAALSAAGAWYVSSRGKGDSVTTTSVSAPAPTSSATAPSPSAAAPPTLATPPSASPPPSPPPADSAAPVASSPVQSDTRSKPAHGAPPPPPKPRTAEPAAPPPPPPPAIRMNR